MWEPNKDSTFLVEHMYTTTPIGIERRYSFPCKFKFRSSFINLIPSDSVWGEMKRFARNWFEMHKIGGWRDHP